MIQDSSPAALLATVGTSPARILIVDDDQTTCSFCALALSQSGYSVLSATVVEVALSILRTEQPIDLLLADIQMPGLSGLELAQIARESDPAIAIIIMTGHATLDALHQTARRGVADFLSKPFELEELRIAVDQALHKRQLLQESIRLRAVEQLLRSSEALNAILERDQLAQVVVARVRSHVPCAAAFLLLAGPETAQLVAEPPGATILPAGQAVALQALHTGIIQQVPPDQPLCSLDNRTLLAGVTVPLRAQGQTVGVLLLCDEQPDLLTASTQDMLSLLANQAGTALRNAQLYGELQTAYQSLRELDRLKSEFIAIASHELRSPLSIVLGYTKMVRDRGDGDQREFAQRALTSAEQIKTIVDTMVRLRGYELNQDTLSLEQWVLADLIQQAIERLAPTAEQKRQQIELIRVEPELALMADREKVLLVLGNLLDNAIKFSPEGAQIQVTLACWEHGRLLAQIGAATSNPTLRKLGALAPSDWAVVQVADQGIGIAREQQPQIFERFYQVADSLTRREGGVGLGLALVSDLALLQGGLVWLESEQQIGSVFSFALPFSGNTTGDRSL